MFCEPIPWDAVVNLFETQPDLRMRERTMKLRQAVECFREVPADARGLYSADLRSPITMMVGNTPVAFSFINSHTLEKLVGLLPDC